MTGLVVFLAVAIVVLVVVGPRGYASPTAHAAPPGPKTAPAFDCGSWPDQAQHAGALVRDSAALGNVRATLSGKAAMTGSGMDFLRKAVLTVSVNGKRAAPVLLAMPGGSDDMGAAELMSLRSSPSSSDEPLCVARFGGPSPEVGVLVGLYSGGAHCCTWVDGYVVTSGKMLAHPLEYDAGDPGVGVETSGGYAMLLTKDDSFAYAFAPYAYSGLPVEVLALRGTSFTDTTKDHLARVAADARTWWSSYEQATAPSQEGQGDGLGVLAPWVADECLLGKGPQAWATVDRLNAQGKLKGGEVGTGWPSGTKYVKALRSLLVQRGYCSS
jgi:hypothetical protein